MVSIANVTDKLKFSREECNLYPSSHWKAVNLLVCSLARFCLSRTSPGGALCIKDDNISAFLDMVALLWIPQVKRRCAVWSQYCYVVAPLLARCGFEMLMP